MTFTVFTKPWNEPILQLARRIAAMGFDGVELPVRPGFAVTPENMVRELPIAAKIFADHGLHIGSIAVEENQQAIEACAAAGVKLIRTLVKVSNGQSYMDCMDASLRRFESLIPWLEQCGVTIGIQNHCQREVSSVMGIHYLVQRFDPKHIAAVMDVGHCGLAGDLPDLSVNILQTHLVMVNLKNAFWQRTADEPVARYKPVFTTGKDGMGDWPAFINELIKMNYSGNFCLTAEYHKHESVNELIVADMAFAKSLLSVEKMEIQS
jgi:sugar phosphate isomerase/epimerase